MKRYKRYMAFLLCTTILTAGCSDVGQERKKLKILTEKCYESEVTKAANYYMAKHPETEVRVELLEENVGKRHLQIQKKQTEIQMGSGSDVYILDGMNEAILEEDYEEPLFENVNKAIENGTFTALDSYMEKDVYWKNHQYHLPLLEAGKYENRQYVLPLSCIYYVYLGEESREFQGETLSEWMEELESEKNLLWAEKILFGTMELICVRWQQPSLEYEHQKVMFEPEIWENFFKQYYPVYQKVTKDIWEHYGEEEVFGELNRIPGVNLEWAKNGESFICQAVPNLEGRRMASVQAYGAVGMGSEYKKEAYEFLMLFLDGGEEQDNKKEFWKNGAARGVPVQESSWQYFFDANQVYDEKAQEEFMKSFRELDGSFFVNTADRNLYWKANDIIVKNLFAEDENLLLNDKIERLVQEAKEQYEMIVME